MTYEVAQGDPSSVASPVSRRDLVGGLAAGAVTVAVASASQAATSSTDASTTAGAAAAAGSLHASKPADLPIGAPAETHQVAGESHSNLTTNQGVVISDDQNTLKAGARGPDLLEDFIYREKIFHFDHERIPERVVHARGYGAHGYFELTHPLSDVSHADIFQRAGERTPLFARFSTVAGSKGSGDLARDVRGFAVKFYTKQGNWDLVGNDIPVFFIQDAIKFPDLIHSVKPEPDREFPQAQSAHDTFWDYISLTPEAMHMIMWVMSDRGIPRSFAMMEGFGIHTFRLIDKAGAATFVKFHWRPKLGLQSVVWDEALKINGADPDFHRRDLWHAIKSGNFPEWELSVQLFDEAFADRFEFDVLDATKLIPEEMVPLRPVGRMVLDRTVDNFFAETEQVAFCTTHVVPGIDFSNDPLLQGRNFSYLDTQLKRLGGPNFHQIPVNAARCPMANFQRDGHMQMTVPKGRVNYEPNSLSDAGPRENPTQGFKSFPEPMEGNKMRHRSETFADHFSQARQFFISQTEPEQNHIVAAITFELSKVETPSVRTAVLGQVANIDADLAKRIAEGLGHKAPITATKAAMPTRTDLPPSPALSILAKAQKTLKGRKVGILIDDGTDMKLLQAAGKVLEEAGAQLAVVAPKVGGATAADGSTIPADFQLAGGPSVLFDAVVLLLSEQAASHLAKESAAVAFTHDAFAHLKVIGHTASAQPLLMAAGVMPDEGVIALDDRDSAMKFSERTAAGRIWAREQKVRMMY